MPAADPRWYDDTDTPVGDVWAYPATASGAQSAATVRRLYNDFGGALGSDDATNWYVQVVASLTGDDPFLEAGVDVLDDHWIEVRIKAATLGGKVTPTSGPWTPLGAGRSLAVPTLASGEGVEYEFRLNIPAGTTTTAATVNHPLRQRRSVPVPEGLFRAKGNGVHLGLGEWNQSQLLSFGGVAEDSGGASSDVEVGDIELVAEGRYHVFLEQDVTLNTTAADGALGGGEAYFARIYIDDTPAVASVKGNGAASPTEPALPGDELLDAHGNPIELALVRVEDDGTIEQADITARHTLGAWGLSTSGLNATRGPGRGIVGDRLIEPQTSDTVALTASVTRKLWQRTDGSLAYSADPPTDDPFADPIFELTTDGSGVTSSRDLRRFAGFGHELVTLTIRIDGPLAASGGAADNVVGTILPTGRDAQLLPLVGAVCLLDTVGAGSSGSTIIDLEYANPGDAFATMFTSQGTDDRRFTFAFDATVLHAVATLPEVVQFEGFCRFRAVVDAVPSGGAAPAGVTIILLFAVTG